jgi:hypothetical protein
LPPWSGQRGASAADDADPYSELEEPPVLSFSDDLPVGNLMHENGRKVDRPTCRRHFLHVPTEQGLPEVPEDRRPSVGYP